MPGPLREEKTIAVHEGMSSQKIAQKLKQGGVITSKTAFLALVHISGRSKQLKAGEYRFLSRSSLSETLDKLVQYDVVYHRFTLAEGMTSHAVVSILKTDSRLKGELNFPAEGSLLPETYLFERDIERSDLVKRMQTAMQRKLASMWLSRSPGLPFTYPHEAVTLASLVEMETSKPEERAHVAGVFIQRLKIGMRLQTDPSVIYALTAGAGSLNRPLRLADLRVDHPYNTYRYKGLPPGPICNPGAASLEAVLNPKITGDLYFVADGKGGHVFARSFEEHQRNVAQWRQIQRQR